MDHLLALSFITWVGPISALAGHASTGKFPFSSSNRSIPHQLNTSPIPINLETPSTNSSVPDYALGAATYQAGVDVNILAHNNVGANERRELVPPPPPDTIANNQFDAIWIQGCLAKTIVEE
eukprot:CAMPEP_0116846090 /NCGR_PEP_ID=MMETSP0418-20121206/13642_1 /TAXON_ID=1158023 /ORGANISM="Astrosyne radiata, Strain 13vi08-1A" /LENGTH=121 /DNA_ID=CAMNT_0004477299 /DNA_START=189 /DNA_END=556 /DNA_ORIENTATION=-